MIKLPCFLLLLILFSIQSQAINVDQGIEDALDHFAIEPKKCLANPSDIPLFLSVRIIDEVPTTSEGKVESKMDKSNSNDGNKNQSNPTEQVYQYERDAAIFAREFEESMVRF